MYIDLKEKPMLDRNEQVLFYSADEYLRRRKAVIAAMKERDVALLLIANPCEEAYASWLGNDVTCSYLMLDAEGTLTLIYGYAIGTARDFPHRPERVVGGRAAHELIPGVRYADGINLEELVAHIGASERVGVINWRYLAKDLCDAIEAKRPAIQWVDMRIPVCMIRVVRSEEEREAIRRTAEMERKLFDAAPLFIREGRRAREMVQDMMHYARELGGGRDELALFFLEFGYDNGGGPLPEPTAGMRMFYEENPRVGKGFKVLLMLEMNRYGGIILDTGKTFSIGEPHPVTKRIYDQSAKAQAYVATLMKPGAIPAEIEEKAVRYAREELDIHMLSWNLLHGMGDTRTEAPDLRDPTTIQLPLMENMHLLCEPNTCLPFGDVNHPSYSFENVVIIPNTYLVTPEGGMQTLDYPNRIFVL